MSNLKAEADKVYSGDMISLEDRARGMESFSVRLVTSVVVFPYNIYACYEPDPDIVMHESDKQDDYRFTRPHVEFIEIPSYVRLMFPIDTVYAPEILNDKYNAFLEDLAMNPRDLKIMHDHPHCSECEPFSF